MAAASPWKHSSRSPRCIVDDKRPRVALWVVPHISQLKIETKLKLRNKHDVCLALLLGPHLVPFCLLMRVTFLTTCHVMVSRDFAIVVFPAADMADV